jgi:glycerol-3-phosphate dehydrogenase
MTRQATLEALAQQPNIPVLIVGGGINGIGTFRELAAQGVDVVLVERGDFCSGASAASSHMLHGGLRYLENAEFRLVREALYERNLLLRNAPHYAHPLPTTIPIFSWFSGFLNAPLKFLNLLDKPTERGAVIIKIGLTFYDIFARRQRVMPTHQLFSRQSSLQKRPLLNPEIVATATYYDAWMPTPERLSLELILDAETLNPNAKALNYVSLASAAGDTVRLKDELTGETFDLRPQVVINAAGPWIDFANQSMQQPTRFIGGTKGSHLVVDHPELHEATQGHEMFFENDDGRIVLFFPLEDRVLMGTTDIRLENPDEAVCTEEEIEYILSLVKKVFPKIEVQRSQIVFTFSGVRPLPAMEANSTGQISRDHSIRLSDPNGHVSFPTYSLVGGKWTTFRAFSEQAADQVLTRLGLSRRTGTEHLPIGGGKDYPTTEADQRAWVKRLAQESGLSEARAQTLFKRYGTRAALIAGFISAEEGDHPLRHAPEFSQREILFVTLHEKTERLEDLVLRRTLLGMLGKLTLPLLEELAQIMGAALGWSATEQAQAVEETVKLFKTRHLTEIK